MCGGVEESTSASLLMCVACNSVKWLLNARGGGGGGGGGGGKELVRNC